MDEDAVDNRENESDSELSGADGSTDNEGDDDSSRATPLSETEDRTRQLTFDLSLPLQHSYLGGDLEELHGRTVLEDNSYVCIPILFQPGIILIPGQTLPLTLFHPSTISMLRNCIDGNRTFGVLSLVPHKSSHTSKPADIGTTAEIYEFRGETETEVGFRVKARGRQRFKVVSIRKELDGNYSAQVVILPEVILPDPLQDIHLQGIDKLRLQPYLPKPNIKSRLRHAEAILTAWPPWVYDQYDADLIVKKMVASLRFSNDVCNTPQNPVELSYWVAQHLPLNDEQRMAVLRLNSAIQRLRYEISLLETRKVLCCVNCSNHIANQKDAFSMSVEGPLGSYCNPGGYVHDTLTVYKAQGLQGHGPPQTEHSWFPGYAWTIVECNNCNRHMGWKFTSTKKHLRPNKFWGLCRQSIEGKIRATDDSDVMPVL